MTSGIAAAAFVPISRKHSRIIQCYRLDAADWGVIARLRTWGAVTGSSSSLSGAIRTVALPCAGRERVGPGLFDESSPEVATSNGRLVRLDERTVTFRCKDYRHGEARREMTLGLHRLAGGTLTA